MWQWVSSHGETTLQPVLSQLAFSHWYVEHLDPYLKIYQPITVKFLKVLAVFPHFGPERATGSRM